VLDQSAVGRREAFVRVEAERDDQTADVEKRMRRVLVERVEHLSKRRLDGDEGRHVLVQSVHEFHRPVVGDVEVATRHRLVEALAKQEREDRRARQHSLHLLRRARVRRRERARIGDNRAVADVRAQPGAEVWLVWVTEGQLDRKVRRIIRIGQRMAEVRAANAVRIVAGNKLAALRQM
jgi:hypothetical protein